MFKNNMNLWIARSLKGMVGQDPTTSYLADFKTIC